MTAKTNYVLAAEKSGAIIRFPTRAESAVLVNRLLKSSARVTMVNRAIQVDMIEVQAICRRGPRRRADSTSP